MTRQDFIDDVNSFWELIEFCGDERLDICEDLVFWDELDGYIMRAIRDFDTWQGIRDFLSDIPDGGEYFSVDVDMGTSYVLTTCSTITRQMFSEPWINVTHGTRRKTHLMTMMM